MFGPDERGDEIFPNSPPLGALELDEWFLKQAEVTSYSGGVETPKLLEYKPPPKLLEGPAKLN
eukprot:10393782-Karenia_brevis.AAC.1